MTGNVQVYQGCFGHAFDYRGYVSEEPCLPLSDSEYQITFEFIKAVSDTVFHMMYTVYHDNPLVLIGAMFREKLVSHYQTVNINC